jgi:hypothetical protein
MLVLFRVMWILLQVNFGISPQVFKICSRSSQDSLTISSMFSLMDLLLQVICHIPIIIICLLHLLWKMMSNLLET